MGGHLSAVAGGAVPVVLPTAALRPRRRHQGRLGGGPPRAPPAPPAPAPAPPQVADRPAAGPSGCRRPGLSLSWGRSRNETWERTGPEYTGHEIGVLQITAEGSRNTWRLLRTWTSHFRLGDRGLRPGRRQGRSTTDTWDKIGVHKITAEGSRNTWQLLRTWTSHCSLGEIEA